MTEIEAQKILDDMQIEVNILLDIIYKAGLEVVSPSFGGSRKFRQLNGLKAIYRIDRDYPI